MPEEKKHDIRHILALITLLGCLILVGIMQFHQLPDTNKDMLNIAIGFLFGSCLSPVFQFFFGSSKQEADKDKNNGVNRIVLPAKTYTMPEDQITGYKLDLPEGAQTIDGVPFAEYTAAEYYPETDQYYGLIVWDATTAITNVNIDGENIPVQPVLNGAHPTQKPKPHKPK